MLELEKEYTIITICDNDFMDYLIVNKLIITNWHILPNTEIMIVYVRKEKGED